MTSKIIGLANQKAPYISPNGNWFEWNEDLLKFEDSGIRARGNNAVSPSVAFRLEPNGDLYVTIIP